MGEVAERARVKLPWSYANSRPIKAPFSYSKLFAKTNERGLSYGKKRNYKPSRPDVAYAKNRRANEQG